MSNPFQKEIDNCKKNKSDCEKQLKSIAKQDKFSMILIACSILVATVSLFIGDYVLALFLCVLSVVNYFINKSVQSLIPNYHKYIEMYDRCIHDYENNLGLSKTTLDALEAIKTRTQEVKRPIP